MALSLTNTSSDWTWEWCWGCHPRCHPISSWVMQECAEVRTTTTPYVMKVRAKPDHENNAQVNFSVRGFTSVTSYSAYKREGGWMPYHLLMKETSEKGILQSGRMQLARNTLQVSWNSKDRRNWHLLEGMGYILLKCQFLMGCRRE